MSATPPARPGRYSGVPGLQLAQRPDAPARDIRYLGALAHNPNVRIALLSDGGTTGIAGGPSVRYWLPGPEQWRL